MNNTNPKPQPFSLPPLAPRPDMSRAASLAQQGLWKTPYPWDTPPPQRQPRFIMGSAIPLKYGRLNQVEICNYTVQPGNYFVLRAVLVRYDGGNFVQGSGDVVFSIDINNPLTINQTNLTTNARALRDFGQILFNLGSFDHGPVWLPGEPQFEENTRIGVKAYAVQNVALGDPNRFNAWLVGYEWPMV